MMVLVDTSVWIGHFRKHDPEFAKLLNEGAVIMHPFVLGEIACGNLKNRSGILTNLMSLPTAACAAGDEVLHLIETRALSGCGIGWVDAHLIASALLTRSALWTLDNRLDQTAVRAGVKRY
jgi:predicted nucleic acid-binding protein